MSDAYYSNAPMPPPQVRKNRTWLWILIGVGSALVIACCIGTLFIVDTAAREVDEKENAKANAVKITECKAGDIGTNIHYTVTNATEDMQSYWIQFEVKDSSGRRLAETHGIHNNVAAGQKLDDIASTLTKTPPGATCSIVKIT